MIIELIFVFVVAITFVEAMNCALFILVCRKGLGSTRLKSYRLTNVNRSSLGFKGAFIYYLLQLGTIIH